MSFVECQNSDFGLIDFLSKRMSFQGQDFLRLLIHHFGKISALEINIEKALDGFIKSLDAFQNDCGETNEDFKRIFESSNAISMEISTIFSEHSLEVDDVLRNRKSISRTKKWLIFELSDEKSTDQNALKYVGAFCSLSIGGFKLAKNLEQTILRLVQDGKEFLSEKAQKDLARLLNRANQTFGVKEKSFLEIIRIHYFFKNYYASDKERQSVADWKSLTASEFLSATKDIYEKVENGQITALIHGLALVVGLPVPLTMQVPILNQHVEDWIITLDINNGLILFDLDAIFENGAKPKNSVDSYEQSTNILVKPLPMFLRDALLKIYLQNHGAVTVADLEAKNDVANHSNRIGRLLNSTGKLAISYCKIDPFHAAVLSGDFRGITTSKNYYRRTTRQTVWDTSNRFFNSIGWGESVPIVDGLAFGSRVVVKDDVVSGLFAHLAQSVETQRPPSRASVEQLLNFHHAFCNYTATFTIFCLALRNANPLRILASDYDHDKRFILVDDKHVLGPASAMPVAVCISLESQMTYWHAHCASLATRLEKLNYPDKKFINLLNGVVDQKDTPLFFNSEAPYIVSVADISATWNVSLVENFSRHFWESRFNEVGVSSRFSGAQLRHQSSGVLSWASDSDFVLLEFIDSISSAQEKVLNELHVFAIHGLSKR